MLVTAFMIVGAFMLACFAVVAAIYVGGFFLGLAGIIFASVVVVFLLLFAIYLIINLVSYLAFVVTNAVRKHKGMEPYLFKDWWFIHLLLKTKEWFSDIRSTSDGYEMYTDGHGQRIYRRINRPKVDIEKLNGWEYEEYVAAALRKGGEFYDVEVTPASGDFGADIVARDRQGNRWVVQCKKYSSVLGNTPVQEVVAAKKHYRASRGAVVTNSRMSEKAKQLARENGIGVVEGYRDGAITLNEMLLYDFIYND